MASKKKTYRILSLFANIGVAEALIDDFCEIAVANEIDPLRAELYQAIYPKSQMICGDITDVDTFNLILNQSKKNNVNIIMATPPCQGMSTAGKMKKLDPRNRLFLYALRLIKEIKPLYFMFENVPAFMTTYVEIDGTFKLIPDVISTEMSDNYHLDFSIINSQDYGVPQRRERVILLATRNDVGPIWSMPVKEDHIVTMEEAIGWIPIIDPFVRDLPPEKFKALFPEYEKRREAALAISRYNIPTSHVYRNVYAMQHTPTGRSAFNNEKQFRPKKKNGDFVRGFGNTYKRQNWDTPAYTIAMDNIEISSQNNVHPGRLIGKDDQGHDIYSDARALTLYELMRLMTIPDNWPLPDNVDLRLLRRTIGEGIPSLLVKKIYSQLV